MHFNAMPTDVRARFDDFVKKDSLTDTMRLWRDKYMHLDNGVYVENNMPDTTRTSDLPDDVAKELFLVCQNAFVGMNSAMSSFKDTDPLSVAFVNEYFGTGKLFNISKASTSCEEGITEILELIKSNPSIKQWVSQAKDEDGNKIFDNQNALEDFLRKCDSKDYNTNGKVQSKIKKVAGAFQRATWNGVADTPLAPIGELQHLNDVIASDAFAMDPDSIDSTKLTEFRENILPRNNTTDNGYNTGILQTLYRSKTIRDKFAKHDNGVITGIINKAETEIDYQKKDSANYVAPKVNDSLNPLQQLEKWCSDTYADTLKKYEELRGAPLFFFPESEDIFRAIDKEKIKPADGLNTVLDKASSIQNRLNASPQAKLYFNWFLETINEVKADIPKAIEGAWKDGQQMRTVIDKIILRAAAPNNDDPHAMQKAMVAMEIMNAMKYGMLTGRLVEALKQTDFSLFSDDKLSWNKNEGIQFVTKALDKSIRAAFIGIGYVATFARNKIMLSKARTKYKDKHNQNGTAIGDAFQEQESIRQSQQAIQNQDLRNEISSIRQGISDSEQDLNDLATDGIDSNTISGKEQDVQNYKTSLDAQQTNENSFQEKMGILRHKMELERDISNLTAEITSTSPDSLQDRITKAEAKYRNPDTYRDMPTRKKEELGEQLYDEWKNLEKQLNDKRQELADKNNELTTNSTNFANAKTYITAHRGDHITYRHTEKKYNSLKEKTKKFREATANLQEQNEVLRAKNDAMQNWDKEHCNKVFLLQKFWNELQSGHEKSFGISTKNPQRNFTNERKAELLNQIYSQQTL